MGVRVEGEVGPAPDDDRGDHVSTGGGASLELIEKGLGYSYEGLERTVDSHIKNLRRKLCEAGAAQDLIETVYGVGYRLVAEGES